MCSFRLVLEEKTGKGIPATSRLEFLEKSPGLQTVLFYQMQKTVSVDLETVLQENSKQNSNDMLTRHIFRKFVAFCLSTLKAFCLSTLKAFFTFYLSTRKVFFTFCLSTLKAFFIRAFNLLSKLSFSVHWYSTIKAFSVKARSTLSLVKLQKLQFSYSSVPLQKKAVQLSNKGKPSLLIIVV